MTIAAQSAISPGLAPEKPSISWRLIENRTTGYQAEISIHNAGKESLGRNWTIYFNSSSRLLVASVQPEFEMTHLNGDFYSLRPGEDYAPIPPGKSTQIVYDGTPWALNITDAPSGFYIVPDGSPGIPMKPIALALHIEPFPEAAKIRRGMEDAIPAVTAETRFKDNEHLTLLPPESLIKVIPTPCDVQPLDGSLRLNASTVVRFDNGLASEANHLASALERLLGTKIVLSVGSAPPKRTGNAIRLRVGDVAVQGSVKQPGDEAYQLIVSADDGVEIIGSDPAGVFYGIQTFRAILPNSAYDEPSSELEINAVRISDVPRFAYRGLHLDVARNFHSKEAVKRLLDLMAFYKLNRFHFHLTDDEGWRIEIRQLPEQTAVGGRRGHTLNENECLVPSYGSGPDPHNNVSAGNGFYTQPDFVEILRYAASRHITVIPEIDLPGHARAAIKAMVARAQHSAGNGAHPSGLDLLLRTPGDESRYESVQMWHDNIVDVGREDTYRFLSIVTEEFAEMYSEAGLRLSTLHVGGDEVPNGVWEKSPTCENIPFDAGAKISRRVQLQKYFLDRASELLAKHAIQTACWEDSLLHEVAENPAAGEDRRASGKPTPTAYVWNNVPGSGNEDAAYRLANAGFDVVLCNATHLYFDLAYEKDPFEPGSSWAGFVDVRKPFEFAPLDMCQNVTHDMMGRPINQQEPAKRTRLMENRQDRILGIQGQLWSENLRDKSRLEYMAVPRLIALAERAWARSPQWASIRDSQVRDVALRSDWNQFANRLGQLELPRLDKLCDGIEYRLAPPGAVILDGQVHANVALPGLEIRYTLDGTEPTPTSHLYERPFPAAGEVRLRTFNRHGRGSRTTILCC